MASELKNFSLEEVSKHNTEDDCWIIMDSKVYDVSKFLEEHPGGGEVILELAGKDATSDFADIGHSKDAKEMASQYLIGQVAVSAPAAPAAADVADVAAPATDDSTNCCSSNWTNYFIPIVIALAVYVLYQGAAKTLA